MRVYELARELDVESKELLARAVELGIEAKTASSGLDEDSAELIRLSFQEPESASEPRSEAAVEAPPTAVEEPAPAPAEPQTGAPPPVVETEAPPAPEPAGRGAAEPASPPPVEELRLVEMERGGTVADLAAAMDMPVGPVVRALLDMGEMASASTPVPDRALDRLAERFGHVVTLVEPEEEEVEEETVSLRAEIHPEDRPEDLESRPPVVTVMGHVDHGKTQLLDTIRRTNVVAGEAGGITQHIGAYQIERGGRRITFIDTPGHEAFTALRARGANVTDIVVLVVAADDGVMPQTAEAISHALAAQVPVIVAINKMDLPNADAYRVRAELTEHNIVVEDLGGEVVSAEVSALTGDGVDYLLELIDLVAELEDLKANPDAPASGVVIESELDKGRGPVATVVVQRGTLRVGDALVAGPVAGRVRAMLDENNKQLKEAGPSTPVLIMGWDEVPGAGERFRMTADDRTARAEAADTLDALRAQRLVVPTPAERMAMILEEMRTADEAELRLLVKADANGSLEAIRDAIAKITREGGRISIVHSGVGGINESDILLAEASQAIVIGFNTRPDSKARKAAEAASIEIRTYRIIYELLDEVEKMLVGKLAPEEVEEVLGVAEVRATFRAPRLGTVAGCYVTEGEIVRGARARLVRDGVVVYDGSVASLRRFKDDVRTVSSGFECGIGLENFRDIKEGDVIETFRVREVAAV